MILTGTRGLQVTRPLLYLHFRWDLTLLLQICALIFSSGYLQPEAENLIPDARNQGRGQSNAVSAACVFSVKLLVPTTNNNIEGLGLWAPHPPPPHLPELLEWSIPCR
jgi:hypothetical protein